VADDCSTPDLSSALSQELDALGQHLAPEQMERLLVYLAELQRWNRAYNLTAVTDPAEMVDRHLIDSLSVRPFLQGRLIADVGTGAGLPGMVLAIAEPERKFMLIDSNGKKVRFLRHVARTLALDNVEPIQARIENLPAQPRPDDILARALAPLPRMVQWLEPWLSHGSRLLAMKGPLADEEIQDIGPAWRARNHPLHLPGQGERCLVEITAAASTRQ